MKFPVYIILFSLMLSPAFSYAESQTISVETGSSSYEKGSIVNISGMITDYDESDPLQVFEITLRIVDPKSNIVSVDQISPNSGGTYSIPVNTDGTSWKFAGDYTVMINYGSMSATTTFTFVIPEEEKEVVAAEAEAEAAAAEAAAAEAAAAEAAAAAEKCGEGTHLEDGVCVLDETVIVEEVQSPSTSSAETVSSWVYSITFAVLIAFVIAIFLYLISRASRRKSK